MASIRETVAEHLRSAGLGSYGSQAEPVIGALEDREYAIVDQLITFAVNSGLAHSRAVDAIQSAGLSVRPIQSAPADGDTEVGGALGALIDTADELARSMVDLVASIDSLRSTRMGQSARR